MKLFQNKKAVGMTIRAVIGLVLVAIVLFAFVGFTMKLWNAFGNKPEEATINSFDNLVYELNTLEEGKEKIVPYYIQEGLYLYTQCEVSLDEHGLKGKEIFNDICICNANCKKRHGHEAITWVKKDGSQTVTISGPKNYIDYNSGKEVMNLKITRDSKGVIISIAG